MDDTRRDVVEPEELAMSVTYRIRLLQIAAYKSFEKVVTGFGPAPRYYGMLKIIEANPGITQTRLAEAIFLDRSSLVPILESLTKEGWIDRKDAPQDRRVRRVYLTELGQERLTALETEVDRHEAQITEGLSEEEKAQLVRLLGKLDANLRAAFGGKGRAV